MRPPKAAVAAGVGLVRIGSVRNKGVQRFAIRSHARGVPQTRTMVFLGAQGMQRFPGPRHRPPRRGIWRVQLAPATKPIARSRVGKRPRQSTAFRSARSSFRHHAFWSERVPILASSKGPPANALARPANVVGGCRHAFIATRRPAPPERLAPVDTPRPARTSNQDQRIASCAIDGRAWAHRGHGQQQCLHRLGRRAPRGQSAALRRRRGERALQRPGHHLLADQRHAEEADAERELLAQRQHACAHKSGKG